MEEFLLKIDSKPEMCEPMGSPFQNGVQVRTFFFEVGSGSNIM